jgi:outer membrane protein TolC
VQRRPFRSSLLFSPALAVAALSAAFPAVAQTVSPAGSAAPAGSPAPVGGEGTSSLFAPPTPGGLTADVVARRAAAGSHEARARAEESAAARAGVAQARASFVPRLSAVARYTRLSSIEQPALGTLVGVAGDVTPGPIPAGTPLVAFPLTFPVILDQYTTQATLQVPLSDYLYRLPRLHEAAAGNARSTALLERATRLRVGTDGRMAYYAWARARLQADVARQALAQAEGHLHDVGAAHTSGAASKADVLRVQSQVATAEVMLARARAATEVTARRLRVIMHDDSGQPYAIGEDLRAPADPGDLADSGRKSTRDLVQEAMAARLEPRALLAGAEAVRAQAGAQRAAGMPRLDAVASATYARPNSRIFPQQDRWKGTWDASVQLTWSPTDLFGVEAGRSATLARARQLEAERAALADGIELEVIQAHQSLLESQVAITSAARGLAAAEESYRVRRALFQNGRATSVELTDAETERSRAQLEAISTRIDQRIATARLRYALGRDATAE